MDPVQNMPNLEAMIKNKYTVREWLGYYRNIWTRNLAARLTDIQTDVSLKAIDPESIVINDDGQQMPVKARLEHRKILVQDAVNLIKNIDTLLALDDANLEKQWGTDALKVADDMIPKKADTEQSVEEKVDEKPEEPSAEAKV